MSRTLHVDGRACIASGLCAAMHPDLFRLNGAGVAEPVRRELTDADDITSAKDVADCCPGAAVSVLGAEAGGPGA
ncbi:ferredoxin [Streptomyces johnsoniae]|uniref:Ferredoxin n=1 Tax=Streptomyces johnsoniae TaxID=3075532 RepID=A0ABU2SFD4_9ACTN|nr:ferredoxin [Streptomyces sp. DSM 41886]MDT0446475.1 ferredoxin [Streptomyces sp. DSM 41886]